MRVLVQRVSSARVSVDGEVVGAIDPGAVGVPHGLVALVGVTHNDTETTSKALADKLFRLRILDGERSAADLGAPILVISQFTLYADTVKGRRPSWNAAAPGAVAEPLVELFAATLRELGATVATGRFGAHMHVELVNDGPVTLMLEG
ncbi:D-aminoacyl-tRNA deacylase [Nocardia sp. NPDC003693]